MEEKEIINCVINAKKDLELANQNFETAESDLVDYYAYQIKANKLKVDYFINKLKNKAI